ncbi:hypothetical protein [Rhizobium grahamii]|uniref:Uncharacterized protein n=2 Tax=Rhizobium grahamii TaxID=1120045 RepID=S3HDS7_9HYPH|nr:hypothetical protein [Rhizobium grahamii]EPE96210.1 hypothetical protein RGCCGE502_21570 [Rhizobium grahamii CCGE 502]RDJ03021.1 hypothetical protein B5K06_31560 [Rhizobium grahamii]
MKLQMFVEAYRLGGLDGLNVALNGLSELERHSFLRELEVIGYTIRWRKAGSRFGYVWSGPKTKS